MYFLGTWNWRRVIKMLKNVTENPKKVAETEETFIEQPAPAPVLSETKAGQLTLF
jgi:hypothetical protein